MLYFYKKWELDEMKNLNTYCQIYVQGHLNHNIAEWLQSFHIQYKENGITIITGPIKDEAALRGLLDRLFELGMCILSFKRLGFNAD